MTTEELIETLERLEKRATSGPWAFEQVDYPNGLDRSFELNAPGMHPVAQTIMRDLATEYEASEVDAANLGLLVFLRNHLPALISALKESKRLREALAFYAAKETWHGRVGDKGMLLEPVATDDGGALARAALRPQGEKLWN